MSDNSFGDDWVSIGRGLRDGESVEIRHDDGAEYSIRKRRNEIQFFIGRAVGTPTKVATINTNKDCFIATVVYADQWCEEVETLRRFRDEQLMNHFLGRILIKYYYSGIGQYWAHQIETKHKYLIRPMRSLLDAFVYIYQKRFKDRNERIL